MALYFPNSIWNIIMYEPISALQFCRACATLQGFVYNCTPMVLLNKDMENKCCHLSIFIIQGLTTYAAMQGNIWKPALPPVLHSNWRNTSWFHMSHAQIKGSIWPLLIKGMNGGLCAVKSNRNQEKTKARGAGRRESQWGCLGNKGTTLSFSFSVICMSRL